MNTRMSTVALFLALVLVTCAQGASIAVTTFPPGQEFKPGVNLLIRAEGLPVGAGLAWHFIPPPLEGEVLDLAKLLGIGETGRVLLFSSLTPGNRIIFLQEQAPGLDPLSRYDFEYGKEKPEPPEPPVPPDPVPGHKWRVMMFSEVGDLDNESPTVNAEQVGMLHGLAFRERLEEKGHEFLGAFDISSRTTGACYTLPNGQRSCPTSSSKPPGIDKNWWLSVAGKSMPRVAVAPKGGGGTIQTFALPRTEVEFFKVLEGLK